jgi:hypothetical protein
MAREGALPAAQVEAVQQSLTTLRRTIGARCVVLANGEGQPLVQVGSVQDLALAPLLAALAEEAAVTLGLDRCLAERVNVSLHHYEGSQYQLFAAVAVDSPLILLVLQQNPSTHPGVVWLFLRRALQEVRGLLGVEGAIRLLGPWGTLPLGGLTEAQARALGLLPEGTEDDNP